MTGFVDAGTATSAVTAVWLMSCACVVGGPLFGMGVKVTVDFGSSWRTLGDRLGKEISSLAGLHARLC